MHNEVIDNVLEIMLPLVLLAIIMILGPYDRLANKLVGDRAKS